MKVILIISCFIAVTSALPTLSTMFPFLFKTRPPQTTPMPATIRREYNIRRTTNFFTKSKGKGHEKRKFRLQVSFGPIIYPENTTPIYDEEEVAAQPQRPRPRPTTTEQPDYEQIQESEEEILSEGYTEPPKRTTTTTTTVKPFKKKPFKASFFQHLQEKFPKIQDWLYDSESAAAVAPASQRQPRMPHGYHKKKHHHRHPKTFYNAPKKPKHILTPPKKVAPKRRPTTSRPRPRPTTQPPFEEEEDIQPGGQTPPPPPPKKRPTTSRPTEFQQLPAKPFEEEQDIQPGGQTPQNQNGYNYQKPQQISKEIFFFEPPAQFAPKRPKPILQKPPLQPKKQYKVIFIKAPEPEPPIIPELPQIQPAPEQKTLIYVVAKRPEEPPKITFDQPVETSSTKPDVFFVRYKVTTTTPLPDETEEDIQPGGQLPEKPTSKPGYKYPKPTPKPTPKPRPKPRPTTTTPQPEESEEDIQPGGQTEPEKPSELYLPGEDPAPVEEEEDIQPGGQLPPDNEYLPPDEEEEDIMPGGQEPTTPEPTYLPPVPDEEEEDIQPAGQLPPPPPTPTYDYLPQRPPEYGQGLQPGVTVPRPYSSYYPQAQQPDNKYLPQPPKYGTASNSYSIPISSSYGQQQSNTYGNYNSNSQNQNNNANSYNNLNSNSYFPQDNTYSNYNQQNENSYYNHNQPTQDNVYYNNKLLNPNNYNQQKHNYLDQIEPATQIYFPQPQPLDYNERYFSRRALIHEDESLKNLLFTSLGLTPFR